MSDHTDTTQDFLNPMIDYVFKKIFGREDHKAILIRFLNDFLAGESDRIVDLRVLNPINDKEYPKDKETTLDIKAKVSDGRYVNIEVQLMEDITMVKRTLFYWGETYTRQLGTGMVYHQLAETIMINILSYELLPHDEIHSTYHITHDRNHQRLVEDLEIHFVELPKLLKSPQKLSDEIKTWLLFLTDPGNKGLAKKSKEVKEVEMAIDLLKEMSQSEEERMRAASRERFLRDKATLYESGRIKGLVEGEEIGLRKGEELGMKKIVVNMLKKGKDAESISESTDISIEMIKKIMRELKNH